MSNKSYENDRPRWSLTPAVVVEESRDEAALLHPMFEWDDASAAERYRQGMARCGG
jgi:hypothetical protein